MEGLWVRRAIESSELNKLLSWELKKITQKAVQTIEAWLMKLKKEVRISRPFFFGDILN